MKENPEEPAGNKRISKDCSHKEKAITLCKRARRLSFIPLSKLNLTFLSSVSETPKKRRAIRGKIL